MARLGLVMRIQTGIVAMAWLNSRLGGDPLDDAVEPLAGERLVRVLHSLGRVEHLGVASPAGLDGRARCVWLILGGARCRGSQAGRRRCRRGPGRATRGPVPAHADVGLVHVLDAYFWLTSASSSRMGRRCARSLPLWTSRPIPRNAENHAVDRRANLGLHSDVPGVIESLLGTLGRSAPWWPRLVGVWCAVSAGRLASAAGKAAEHVELVLTVSTSCGRDVLGPSQLRLISWCTRW